jgi:hypothetical protein
LTDSTERARVSPIFISYKREEFAYASALRKRLETSGYVVWWDQALQTGGEWAAELDQQLADSSCVIVLWSRRAAASPWMRHEASTAIGRAKYLPAKIETMDIPDPFGRIQAAELMGWDGSQTHSGFDALLQSLERILKQPRVAYAVTDTERNRPWPEKVPRRLSARFARWISQNVAAVVAALALVALAYLAMATERSVRTLDAQVTKVKSTVEIVDKTMSNLADRQGAIVDQLGQQNDASRTLATDLGNAAGVITSSAVTTRSLLFQSLKTQEFLEFWIYAKIQIGDPNASEAGTRVPARSRAILDAWTNYTGFDALNNAVLADWHVTIRAVVPHDRRVPEEVTFAGEEGNARVSWDDQVRFHDNYPMPFHLSYRVPLSRLMPARPFEDFPGSTIVFEADGTLITPVSVIVRLGLQPDRKLYSGRFRANDAPVPGYSATVAIPKGYLDIVAPAP